MQSTLSKIEQSLISQVEDIKQKISDQEYKKLMDTMMKSHNNKKTGQGYIKIRLVIPSCNGKVDYEDGEISMNLTTEVRFHTMIIKKKHHHHFSVGEIISLPLGEELITDHPPSGRVTWDHPNGSVWDKCPSMRDAYVVSIEDL
jgi:hypothetical protein